MSSSFSAPGINVQNYINGLGINRNRVVLHSDINNFFASVECLKNPKIASFPVAVCGKAHLRHGIVLAKNQIAKQFDVKTGDTIFEAQKKCPSIIVVNPDYDLYMEYAEKVRRMYYEYSDRIEPFGMDEAFIELTDGFCVKNLFDGKTTADKIRKEIFEKTGLTVSVGVSDNKAFAKLASDYKKPYATTIFGPFNYEKSVAPLNISDMLYVGSFTKSRLNSHGIFTIGEAANTDEHVLKRILGKAGITVHSYACGYDNSKILHFGEQIPPKSMSNSTTTPADMTCLSEIKLVLCSLCEKLCESLRRKKLRAGALQVSVRDENLSWTQSGATLSCYTNNTQSIFAAAVEIFKNNFENAPYSYRSIGIRVCPLIYEGEFEQTNIFEDNIKKEKREKLDKTVDILRARFGNDCILRAIILENRENAHIDTGYEVFTSKR